MEICARMRTNTSSVSLGGGGEVDAAGRPAWHRWKATRQSSWQDQAQFPGVSSSCMACAYLLRDSDCSLLPAMAASSFAGEENNSFIISWCSSGTGGGLAAPGIKILPVGQWKKSHPSHQFLRGKRHSSSCMFPSIPGLSPGVHK